MDATAGLGAAGFTTGAGSSSKMDAADTLGLGGPELEGSSKMETAGVGVLGAIVPVAVGVGVTALGAISGSSKIDVAMATCLGVVEEAFVAGLMEGVEGSSKMEVVAADFLVSGAVGFDAGASSNIDVTAALGVDFVSEGDSTEMEVAIAALMAASDLLGLVGFVDKSSSKIEETAEPTAFVAGMGREVMAAGDSSVFEGLGTLATGSLSALDEAIVVGLEFVSEDFLMSVVLVDVVVAGFGVGFVILRSSSKIEAADVDDGLELVLGFVTIGSSSKMEDAAEAEDFTVGFAIGSSSKMDEAELAGLFLPEVGAVLLEAEDVAVVDVVSSKIDFAPPLVDAATLTLDEAEVALVVPAAGFLVGGLRPVVGLARDKLGSARSCLLSLSTSFEVAPVWPIEEADVVVSDARGVFDEERGAAEASSSSSSGSQSWSASSSTSTDFLGLFAPGIMADTSRFKF